MSEFTEEEKKKIEDLERYAKMSFEEQLKYARTQIKDVSERYGAIKERVDISKDVMSDKDIDDAEKRAAFVEQYKKINEEYRELSKNYRNLSEEDKIRYWSFRNLLNSSYGSGIVKPIFEY